MIITSSARIDIKTNTTAGELIEALKTVPENATLSVTKEKYYDQRDPGSTYITATWRVSK